MERGKKTADVETSKVSAYDVPEQWKVKVVPVTFSS
jgi:hypothetical protein